MTGQLFVHLLGSTPDMSSPVQPRELVCNHQITPDDPPRCQIHEKWVRARRKSTLGFLSVLNQAVLEIARLACLCIALNFISICAVAAAEPKIPLPPQAARNEAEKTIRELYGNDIQVAKTSDQKHELAAKLLEQARQSGQNPAAQFVLFKTARDVAVEGGAVAVAMEAIEELASRFEFLTGPVLKADAIALLAKSARSRDQNLSLYSANAQAMDEAIWENDYEVAQRLGALLQRIARVTRTAEISREANARVERLEAIKNEYARVKPSILQVKADATDSEASLTVGKFYCFQQGNWETGLKLLAQGNDPMLKALAEREFAEPPVATDQLQIADAWWDFAATQTAANQKRIKEHAAAWYAKAAPGLAGLDKTKAEKRRSEMPPPRALGIAAVNAGRPVVVAPVAANPVARPAMPANPGQIPKPTQRQMAEMVIGIGGMVDVVSAGRLQERVAQIEKLAEGEFVVRGIYLLSNPKVGAELISAITTLPKLEVLTLDGCPLDDDGLAQISTMASLRHLIVSWTQITDRGLANLSPCKQLVQLNIDRTAITDEGLSAIAGLKELKTVVLFRTGITDKSIPILCGMPKLNSVWIWDTGISGAGLQQLKASLPSCHFRFSPKDPMH